MSALPVLLVLVLALALVLGLGGCSDPAPADRVNVAVAANFTQPAREIGAAFEAETGHAAVFSFGSTGQLYTQITQDAPFEVFLAADQVRPAMAVESGLAVADSRFTYATGRLVLYSEDKGLVAGADTLASGGFTRIAIANPVTAPYGSAAIEVLKALGVHAGLKPRLVQGTNIAQTYQFVETRNAELGLVAWSQVVNHERGSRWVVPERLHTPIAQDAVLLEKGRDHEAARAFVRFLQAPAAKAIIERYGYSVPGGPSETTRRQPE